MDVNEFYEKYGHWPSPEEMLMLYVKDKKPVKKQAKKKKAKKKK